MEKGGRIRLFLVMIVLLSFLKLMAPTAAADKTLEGINESPTAATPMLQWTDWPWTDALAIVIAFMVIAILLWTIIQIFRPESTVTTNHMSSFEARCESVRQIISAILVALLLILLIILMKGGVLSEGDVPPASSFWAAIVIVAIVFLFLIYMGCAVDGTLDRGEMRRTIAGTFVIGFTILIFFLALYPIENKEIVTAYLQMVGVIVGFYFGSKSALTALEKRKETAIMKVMRAARKALEANESNDGANKVFVAASLAAHEENATKESVIAAAEDAKKNLENETDKEGANKVIGAMEGALQEDD